MSTPGEASQPQDTEGDGTVTLEDRTEPGGQGSPDTNQGKGEPMPTADHEAAVPDLESMNVGSHDPQSPSHPAATAFVDQAGGGVGLTGNVAAPPGDGASGTSEVLQPDNGPGPQDDPDLPE